MRYDNFSLTFLLLSAFRFETLNAVLNCNVNGFRKDLLPC